MFRLWISWKKIATQTTFPIVHPEREIIMTTSTNIHLLSLLLHMAVALTVGRGFLYKYRIITSCLSHSTAPPRTWQLPSSASPPPPPHRPHEKTGWQTSLPLHQNEEMKVIAWLFFFRGSPGACTFMEPSSSLTTSSSSRDMAIALISISSSSISSRLHPARILDICR